MSSLQEKLASIKAELCDQFVERDAVIEGLLACLLSGEHALLLGPVGTAKSLLAAEVCRRLEGGRHFSWLLTKFSTPEELFGPISLKSLEADEYRRVTSAKLPEAHVAFLDEAFKASSAILNALLSLMNERLFYNGRVPTEVPLITMIAASNELPEDDTLDALYDRFLVRFVVDYIREDFRFLQMLKAPTPGEPATTLTLSELQTLRDHAQRVEVPDHVLGDLVEIRRMLNKKEMVVSDRRYRKAIELMKGYASIRGRDHVTEVDFEALEHVLWNDPDDREELRLILRSVFRAHEESARGLLEQAREVADYAGRGWNDPEYAMRASIEAHTKLRDLLGRAEGLLEDARQRRRHTDRLEQIIESIRGIQRDILAMTLSV